jgi:hypothetical protein
MPNQPDENVPPQPQAEPSVLELLLARIDGYCNVFEQELDLLERVTDQLAPDRARACHTAIEIVRVGVDEIKLRAHARPLDEPE